METENKINTSKKRSILLSILLSLVTPGLGHLYNGKLKLAIIIPISFIVVTNIIYQLSLVKSFLFLVILVLIFLGTYIFTIIHSVYLAKNNKEYQLKHYNKFYFYILFVIIYFAIGEIIPLNSSIRTFSIPTTGMENTLMAEDFILADMDYYNFNKVVRNDLVIFNDPRYPTQLLIKRAIAFEDEKISIENGNIFINGQAFEEKNKSIIFEADFFADLTETVIPKDHIFFIGDNRPNSLDSRMFGSIATNSIKGKPLYVYFSNSLNRIGQYVN